MLRQAGRFHIAPRENLDARVPSFPLATLAGPFRQVLRPVLVIRRGDPEADEQSNQGGAAKPQTAAANFQDLAGSTSPASFRELPTKKECPEVHCCGPGKGEGNENVLSRVRRDLLVQSIVPHHRAAACFLQIARRAARTVLLAPHRSFSAIRGRRKQRQGSRFV